MGGGGGWGDDKLRFTTVCPLKREEMLTIKFKFQPGLGPRAFQLPIDTDRFRGWNFLGLQLCIIRTKSMCSSSTVYITITVINMHN